MRKKLLRVAVYIRVSSDEQAERGDSIRDQQERCTEYINRHPDMVLQDLYIDDGISGQKLKREDFTRLLQAVKEGKVDLIIFTKLDLWFPSLRHYLNTQAVLDKYNVGWTAIDQPYFDTSTPYGRAFVNQSMTWAELEAQNGGIRVRDVFKTKVSHGEAITGKCPKGYKIENKHLVLSDQAPAIYDSIQYFCKTHSLNATARYMKDVHGLVTSNNNLKESILKNEKYTGRYRDNPNYCPRLISDETWNTVQNILNSRLNIKSSQKYPYIFSGLLVCTECGKKMTACHINVVSKRVSGQIYRYSYPAYECRQHRRRICANGRQIREVRIEEYLLEHVQEQLNSYIADFQTAKKTCTDQRARRQALQKKIDRLKDLYINELITLDEYKQDRFRLEEQMQALPEAQESGKERDLLQLQRYLSGDFKAMYSGLNNEEKRRFWRSIIKEIRVPMASNRQHVYDIIFL